MTKRTTLIATAVVFMTLALSACHIPWPTTPPIHGSGGTASQGRCTQWDHLLEANGLPVDRFSGIMWRESRCDPNAVNRSSGATGLLQIMPQWITRWGGCDDFSRAFGGCSVAALKDPGWNIYYASKIFAIQGYRAWSQTA